MRFDMAKSSKSAGKARSAVTGAYVKPGYAKSNPTTTVVERPKSKGAAKKK
jgi:hypothetical protein